MIILLAAFSFALAATVRAQTICSYQSEGDGGYKASWVYDTAANQVQFAIEAKQRLIDNFWTGIGFGRTMKSADMVIISSIGGLLTVSDRHSAGYHEPAVDNQQDIQRFSGRLENGIIYANFSRLINTGDAEDKPLEDPASNNCQHFMFPTTGGPVAGVNPRITVEQHINTPKVRLICNIARCLKAETRPTSVSPDIIVNQNQFSGQQSIAPSNLGNNIINNNNNNNELEVSRDVPQRQLGNQAQVQTEAQQDSAQRSVVSNAPNGRQSNQQQEIPDNGQQRNGNGNNNAQPTAALLPQQQQQQQQPQQPQQPQLPQQVGAAPVQPNQQNLGQNQQTSAATSNSANPAQQFSPQLIAAAAAPPVCEYAEGRYRAQWTYDEITQRLTFNLSAPLQQSRWTGIGLGQEMRNGDMLIIQDSRGRLQITDRHGTGHVEPLVDNHQDVESFKGVATGGYLQASFNRILNTLDSDDLVIDDPNLNNCQYFIFPVSGGNQDENGKIQIHDSVPKVKLICNVKRCKRAAPTTGSGEVPSVAVPNAVVQPIQQGQAPITSGIQGQAGVPSQTSPSGQVQPQSQSGQIQISQPGQSQGGQLQSQVPSQTQQPQRGTEPANNQAPQGQASQQAQGQGQGQATSASSATAGVSSQEKDQSHRCANKEDHNACKIYVDDYLNVVYARFPKTDAITQKACTLLAKHQNGIVLVECCQYMMAECGQIMDKFLPNVPNVANNANAGLAETTQATTTRSPSQSQNITLNSNQNLSSSSNLNPNSNPVPSPALSSNPNLNPSPNVVSNPNQNQNPSINQNQQQSSVPNSGQNSNPSFNPVANLNVNTPNVLIPSQNANKNQEQQQSGNPTNQGQIANVNQVINPASKGQSSTEKVNPAQSNNQSQSAEKQSQSQPAVQNPSLSNSQIQPQISNVNQNQQLNSNANPNKVQTPTANEIQAQTPNANPATNTNSNQVQNPASSQNSNQLLNKNPSQAQPSDAILNQKPTANFVNPNQTPNQNSGEKPVQNSSPDSSPTPQISNVNNPNPIVPQNPNPNANPSQNLATIPNQVQPSNVGPNQGLSPGNAPSQVQLANSNPNPNPNPNPSQNPATIPNQAQSSSGGPNQGVSPSSTSNQVQLAIPNPNPNPNPNLNPNPNPNSNPNPSPSQNPATIPNQVQSLNGVPNQGLSPSSASSQVQPANPNPNPISSPIPNPNPNPSQNPNPNPNTLQISNANQNVSQPSNNNANLPQPSNTNPSPSQSNANAAQTSSASLNLNTNPVQSPNPIPNSNPIPLASSSAEKSASARGPDAQQQGTDTKNPVTPTGPEEATLSIGTGSETDLVRRPQVNPNRSAQQGN